MAIQRKIEIGWQTRARARAIMAWLQKEATPNRSVFLLLAAAFVAFSPSLGASFHLDDDSFLSDSVVTSPSGWWRVWRPLQTRPLTYFTFWLNYQLGGSNAVGYHAFNLGLHLIVVWLLFQVLSRIIGDKAALIAAALCALHPIQTEPVVYVFERATLLSTMFCLLSMRSWLDTQYGPAAGWFTLALLSKEECVAFPLFLLLLRPVVVPAAGMLCLSLAAGLRVLLALRILNVRGAGASAGMSSLDYFSTQGTVILRYFRLLFAPYGFSCDPDIPIVRDWRAWLAWAGIIAAAAILWRVHRNAKWLVGGLVLLLPSSSIFPAEDLAADRRLYLPMVAFAALGGLILTHLKQRLIMVPLALGLAALSFARAAVWSNERALWAEAMERAPKKLRPRIMLARASDLDQALSVLDGAHEIAPTDPRPPLEKGLRLMQAGMPDLASIQFEHALALAPNDVMALNNHGAALAAMGNTDGAIEEFRHALRVDPCWASARANLARLGVTHPIDCPSR
jgi:protein O-mannosyl-transferase